MEVPGLLDARNPLPFEHLFAPLVLDAREELRRQVDAAVYGLLAPEAHDGWEHYLLERLTTAGAEAALGRFQIFKTVRMAFPQGQPKGYHADAVYRDYIGARPQSRLRELFDESPALAKLSSVLINNWIATVIEFLARLAVDSQEFDQRFENGNFIVPAIRVQAGLGDSHRGGRTVAKVSFESGASLIYKPRSVAPEASFEAMVGDVNALNIPHWLRAAHCWDQGEYGWMENIEHRPCNTDEDVHSFYWRAGALLGLVYIARGLDCHQGNLIASGASPILVDLEALLHPPIPTAAQSGMDINSVLRTGFLPRVRQQANALYQWSGLSVVDHTKRPAMSWFRVNQDNMSLEAHQRVTRRHSHLPVLENTIRLAPRYVCEVQRGFRWVGDNLLDTSTGRTKLLRWLHNLAQCPRRLLLRPTVLYQAILRKLTAPFWLRMKQSTTDKLKAFNQKEVAEISEEEWRALEQLDIPYFEQSMSGKSEVEGTGLLPSTQLFLSQITVIADSLADDP